MSFLERITYEYDFTLQVIRTWPLLGRGLGHTMIGIYELLLVQPRIQLPAHNTFLVVWAELGIVGLFLYATATLTMLWHGWRHWTDENAAILTCGWIGIIVILLLDYYMWGDLRSQLLFFMYLGWMQGTFDIAAEHRPPMSIPNHNEL
jgi:O-antigen ligase